jgi:hypothetical protein
MHRLSRMRRSSTVRTYPDREGQERMTSSVRTRSLSRLDSACERNVSEYGAGSWTEHWQEKRNYSEITCTNVSMYD